jgi:hypothetical protein
MTHTMLAAVEAFRKPPVFTTLPVPALPELAAAGR